MFSWIINMFVGNLPIWMWPAAAGASITIYFLAGIISHIPNAKPYAIFIKPVAFIALLISVFMYGGAGVTAIYQEKLKEAQAEVANAKDLSKAGNTQVKTIYVDKVKVVHDRQVVVQHDIAQDAKVIDSECKVTPQAIKDLNEAAK
jgi:hypothetical protein